jgi:hypothetical protein
LRYYKRKRKAGEDYHETGRFASLRKRYPYDETIAFSAVIRSWSGRKSLFPAKAGIVELWASLVAADLNIIEGDKLAHCNAQLVAR